MKKALLFLLFPVLTYGQVQIGQDIDGEAPGDLSGQGISISSNGNIIAVGAIRNEVNGPFTGHVRVYENENNLWVQVGQDIDGETPNSIFGNSVSLSSDGSIIAIGATANDDAANGAGQVKVFQNQGGNWIQIGQDINGQTSQEAIGASVDISSDGSIVAIGAIGGNLARIYENQEGVWTQIGQDINGNDTPPDNSDFFGESIHISSDGSIFAVGAPGNDDNGSNSGHVRAYENQEGNWVQIGQDINGQNAADQAGLSLSLSPDGNILAVASIFNNNNGQNSGQTRIYENQNGNWTQIGQDINGDAGNSLGEGISLSSDGTIIAIGSRISNDVRMFKNQNGNWIQIGENIEGENAVDNSGENVSLSSNGTTVVIGARRNNGNGQDSGHVRVYDLSDLLSTEEFTPSTFSLYPNPASTQITIDIPQGTALEKAAIYNSLGKLVISSKSTIIDTSTLSKGMYIVEVFTAQWTSSKKLIIE